MEGSRPRPPSRSVHDIWYIIMVLTSHLTNRINIILLNFLAHCINQNLIPFTASTNASRPLNATVVCINAYILNAKDQVSQ